jgi:hypothetical protein
VKNKKKPPDPAPTQEPPHPDADMGIDTNWKAKLRELYPSAWMFQIPQELRADVLIDDMTLNLRRAMYKMTQGKDIEVWLKKRIEMYGMSGIRSYVALFDESEFVPEAKQETQDTRDKAEKNRPFSAEEIHSQKIRVTDALLPMVTRLLATRSLNAERTRYATKKLMEIEFDKKLSGLTIFVDGGREVSDSSTGTMLVPKFLVRNLGTKNVARMDSNQIGESDLKLVRHISRQEKGSVIYILTCDTDTIPILLLHMLEWIDPADGAIRYKIYLNTSVNGDSKQPSRAKNPKPEAPEVVDLSELWRSIIRTFRERFPGVKNPVETMVLLMIMTGTDFVSNFHGIACNRMWEIFENGGHRIFSDTEQAMMCGFATTEPSWRGEELHIAVIAEHVLYRWVVYLFYRLVIGDEPPKSALQDDMIPVSSVYDKFFLDNSRKVKRPRLEITAAQVRKAIFDRDNSDVSFHANNKRKQLTTSSGGTISSHFRPQKRSKTDSADVPPPPTEDADAEHASQDRIDGITTNIRFKAVLPSKKGNGGCAYFLPDDETVLACIRRFAWNLDYWLNGEKSHWIEESRPGGFRNPLKVDDHSRRPLWGWTRTTDAQGKSSVTKSQVVHKCARESQEERGGDWD